MMISLRSLLRLHFFARHDLHESVHLVALLEEVVGVGDIELLGVGDGSLICLKDVVYQSCRVPSRIG